MDQYSFSDNKGGSSGKGPLSELVTVAIHRTSKGTNPPFRLSFSLHADVLAKMGWLANETRLDVILDGEELENCTIRLAKPGQKGYTLRKNKNVRRAYIYISITMDAKLPLKYKQKQKTVPLQKVDLDVPYSFIRFVIPFSNKVTVK